MKDQRTNAEALAMAGLPTGLVSPKQAASIVDLEVNTIRLWAQRGLVKRYGPRWGTWYMVDLAEILEVLGPIRETETRITRAEHMRRIRAGVKGSDKNKARLAKAKAGLPMPADSAAP